MLRYRSRTKYIHFKCCQLPHCWLENVSPLSILHVLVVNVEQSGAGVSTLGLWHYPATITNATIATEFAQFGPTAGFPTQSTAGVINNISGRQQVSPIA